MRISLNLTGRMAFIAGAALLAASCGGGSEATTENNLSAADVNAMLEQPGNDQSAMESAANMSEPSPAANESTDANGVLGDTSGGDTGGNTVESNVSGM